MNDPNKMDPTPESKPAKNDDGESVETTASAEYTQAADNSSLASPLVTSQPKEVVRLSIDSNDAMALKAARDHKKWNKRLKVLFCCLGYKKNKVMCSSTTNLRTQSKVPANRLSYLLLMIVLHNRSPLQMLRVYLRNTSQISTSVQRILRPGLYCCPSIKQPNAAI